jgi:hypothetical protein
VLPASSHHLNINLLRESFQSLQNTTQLAVFDRVVSGFSASARWNTTRGAAVNTLQVSASGNRIVQDRFRSNPVFGRDVTREGSGVSYPLIYGASRMIPSITIAGACCTALTVTAAAFQNFNHVFQLREDFARFAGTHQLKAGALIVRSLKNQDNQPPVNGIFAFNNLGDALFGRFRTYQEGGGGREGWFRFWQHELYVSDNWRATPRLALDLGIRYSLLQPQHSVLNNAVVFVPELYDPRKAPRIDSATGEMVLTPDYDPDNGLAVGGDRFPPAAASRLPDSNQPVYQRLFRGLPDTIMEWQAGLAPRVSAAYDLLGGQRLLLRGGYGRFFERIQGNYIFNTVNNPPFVLTTTVSVGDVDHPTTASALAIPPNLRSFDRNLKLPTVDNWSIGVQHRLGADAFVEAGYVGAHGFHQTRDSDLNQLPVGTLQRHAGVNPNALRPYPGYGFINQYVTDAEYHYHSLQTLVRVNLRDGGLGQVAYTYSRALTTATNWNTLPVDSHDPQRDRGPADYDRPHILVASYAYPLPFSGEGSGWLRTVLGDWRVAGVTTLQSGLPLNVTVNGDPAGIGRTAVNTLNNAQRPNRIADAALPPEQRTWDRWFDTSAFVMPAPGTFGDLPRNALRHPHVLNTDVSVQKAIPVGPTTLEVRVEAFNVFNRANPFAIGGVLGTATFGQVVQFADPRIVQLVARLSF